MKTKNRFSFSFKNRILDKSKGRCWYCGTVLSSSDTYFTKTGGTSFTIDHFDNNGGNDISNLVPACKDCNGRKKTKTIEDFRKTEAERHGYIFSKAQRCYRAGSGLTLPPDEPYIFYFEKMTSK